MENDNNPPAYSEQPSAAGPSSGAAPYHGGKQPQPGQPVPSAWDDPYSLPNQYQNPPPAGPDPYGQPMAAPYPQPGYYGAPYYGGAPPPPGPPQQQQQQQQVVVVNGGHTQPIIYHQHETFIGQMILACFVLWCCNWLFGLVAFILAVVASTTAAEDPVCARKLGHASWAVSIAGIIITILIVIIVVAVVASAAQEASNTQYYYY